MLEIAYILDKAESEKNGALTVKLQEIERSGFDLRYLPIKIAINTTRWQQLATPKDKDPLRILSLKDVKLDQGYLKIPYSQSIQALKLLAASGKFFFHQKQLICDFFTPVEFYYTVQNKNVTGRLKFLDQDFDLSNCDFICSGS